MLGVIQASSGKEFNTIFWGQPITTWMSVEICLAIICCCLPSLRFLIARIPSSLKILARSISWREQSTSRMTGETELVVKKSRENGGFGEDDATFSGHGAKALGDHGGHLEVTITRSWECHDSHSEKSPC